MISLAIRKWFFDLWDHLLVVVLLNTIYLLSFFFLYLGLQGWMVFVPVGAFLLTLAQALASGLTWCMNTGTPLRWVEVGISLQRNWRPALLLTALNGIMVAGLWFASVPAQQGSGLEGFLPLGLVSGIALLWILAQSWFLPLGAQLETRLSPIIRKTWLLTFAHPGLTLSQNLVGLGIVVLSVVGIGLMPGLAGLLLWQNTILKLRLLGYDWLKEHPETDPKHLPWKILLKPEADRIGKRTLISLIFPWKK